MLTAYTTTWPGAMRLSASQRAPAWGALTPPLQIKKSVAGADPVVKWANYAGLEHGNTMGQRVLQDRDAHLPGRLGQYLADRLVQLGRNNDGKGHRNTYFNASPTV
ncbi:MULTISPECIES: hypothetical protein [Streptomyces]|uniref:Tn3 transposase DDE domain-containing protein n=1 Tax=Streptomyces canarius TaxID=285453 RepID=A0ABQ3DB95_9ACTN|nr:hypothetical protein [Streptomyces canarius]GHA72681.1 hypothetical protein GCM10010345_89500 [Streptomyces canarius]